MVTYERPDFVQGLGGTLQVVALVTNLGLTDGFSA